MFGYSNGNALAKRGISLNWAGIKVDGTGSDETNYIWKTRIHRSAEPNNDTEGYHLFLGNGIKSDFSNLKFYDADWNQLDHYVQCYADAEFVPDNDYVGWSNKIYKNKLYCSNLQNGTLPKGVYQVDNKVITPVYQVSEAKVYLCELLLIDSNGHIYLNEFNTSPGSEIYRVLRSNYSLDDVATHPFPWAESDFTSIIHTQAEWGAIKTTTVPTAVIQNTDGTIYIGEYNHQSVNGHAIIHGSVDGGETWVQVYPLNDGAPVADEQHIHGINVDPFSGKVYFSTDSINTGRRLYKAIKSNTAPYLESAEAIWNSGSLSSEVTTIIFVSSTRRFLFGGNTMQNQSVYLTDDDITFTSLVPVSGSCRQAILAPNGKIYATSSGYTGSAYSQIYEIPTTGTAEEIMAGINSVNIVPNDNVRTFSGHLFIIEANGLTGYKDHYCVGVGEDGGYPAGRLYVGSNHRQAHVHVKMPALPSAGTTIYVTYGDPTSQESKKSSLYTFPYSPSGLTPLFHFDFSDGEGTTLTDISGNNRHGTIHLGANSQWVTNEPIASTGAGMPRSKLYGNAIYFGGDSYINIPGDATLDAITKNFTILARVKIPYADISDGLKRGILSRNTLFSATYLAFCIDGAAGYLQHWWGASPSGKGDNLTGGSCVNDWVLIGMRVSNDATPKLNLLLNGHITTAQDLSGSPSAGSSSKWAIGGLPDGATSINNRPFKGYISDVRLYGSALTDSQIIQIYEGRYIAPTEPKILRALT